MPSSFITGKGGVVGSNPICEAVQDRIIELIPHEIANIWTITDGDDTEFHLVTVIGNFLATAEPCSTIYWIVEEECFDYFSRFVRLKSAITTTPVIISQAHIFRFHFKGRI